MASLAKDESDNGRQLYQTCMAPYYICTREEDYKHKIPYDSYYSETES